MIGVDRESADSEFAAMLLSQDGNAGGVIHIVDKGEGYAFDAAVSFDGLGYLTVWTDQDEVFGHRITQAGELAGTRFTVLDKGAWGLEMAAGAGIHLLVWAEVDGIWAMRVSPAGQVLDPGGYLVAATGPGGEPSVAFDGEKRMAGSYLGRLTTHAGQWPACSCRSRLERLCRYAFVQARLRPGLAATVPCAGGRPPKPG